MLDKIVTDIGRNCDGRRMEWQEQNEWTDGDCDDDGIIERSVFANSTTMACKRKKIILKIIYIYFPELLHGLFTTCLQTQKHIGVHNLDANFKTHVQGKQVYVGLHHLV